MTTSPTLRIAVSPGDGDEELRRKASLVRPSGRQVAWQRQELVAFVHFGINTFTGREHGTGTDDLSLFDPAELDARQWARTLAGAGFRSVILTAKHHDGFALWPSRYTGHSVAATPWRDGKGDVVRDVVDAARAHGLGVGFYLSPADLHHARIPGGFYGNGSPAVESAIPTLAAGDDRAGRVRDGELPSFTYTVDDYNRYYLNQLYELLTEYGPVDEVWLDGADPTGTEQSYAHDAWFGLVRALARDAACAVGGPDVRWVGNESGYARYTEWSVVPLAGEPGPYAQTPVAGEEAHDLAGPEVARRAGHLAWYPAEVDVSIRPGWFHHASQDTAVKTADRLLELYRNSVGRNAVLLLNVPPDPRGLFAEPDVTALEGFGRVLREAYGNDLAAGAARPGPHEVALPEPRTFNVVGLQEDITAGQQVESFAVDTRRGGTWTQTATGTTVGHKRLVTLPEPVTADAVRVRVLAARAKARIGLSLFLDPSVPAPRRYESLAAARDNTGISDDDDPAGAALDPTGTSLSAQALAAAGFTPGARIEHAGLEFTWPDVPPGAPDNVRAAGQTIALHGRAGRIGFLLAGTADRSYGPALARYADGTEQDVPLLALDVLGEGVYPPGAEVAVAMPYHNRPGGRSAAPARVGFCQVPLDPGRTLESLTLPRYGDGTHPEVPGAHLFAIALGRAEDPYT
ncbi:alpha-L-fucosidase [Streptomyces sp. WMMC500]|uniref:alpha-L-fucosidase n=1 Tax=Streptomyces sp. WMMC500 TaxID=3015154 RepID=UPI00248B53C7|nr:alpha-L-fucosidase [Streptomyces sp. WMMC500]WBB64350.1 alpha-L-fucosidase [Streptomyces sp. WMMC500]